MTISDDEYKELAAWAKRERRTISAQVAHAAVVNIPGMKFGEAATQALETKNV